MPVDRIAIAAERLIKAFHETDMMFHRALNQLDDKSEAYGVIASTLHDYGVDFAPPRRDTAEAIVAAESPVLQFTKRLTAHDDVIDSAVITERSIGDYFVQITTVDNGERDIRSIQVPVCLGMLDATWDMGTVANILPERTATKLGLAQLVNHETDFGI